MEEVSIDSDQSQLEEDRVADCNKHKSEFTGFGANFKVIEKGGLITLKHTVLINVT